MTSMSNLITLTRQRANLENNNFCTDPEIQLYLNQSLGELDDILATEYDDYHVLTYQSVIPTNTSSNVIPVPSNLLKIRGVDFQYQPSQSPAQPALWYSVPRFNFLERNQQNPLTVISLPWGRLNVSYNLIDQGIQIIPNTNCAGTYQIWYTPKYNYLIQTTDVLPLYMNAQGWSEYAIVDVCIKIFNKQNIDPSGFMAEKEALKQRIMSAAKNRDSGGVKFVADTRYQNQDFYIGNLYGGFGM